MRDLINSFHVLRDVIKIDRNDMLSDIFTDKKKRAALSSSVGTSHVNLFKLLAVKMVQVYISSSQKVKFYQFGTCYWSFNNFTRF